MKKVFQVSLIACAIGFSSMSQASLQQEMNQLFGSMTNSTAPGVFESQRRGVISGGSVVVRNRIMNENLVSMVPPSFQPVVAALICSLEVCHLLMQISSFNCFAL